MNAQISEPAEAMLHAQLDGPSLQPCVNPPIPQPQGIIHRKIAKLPKPLRDLINSMLEDGHSAREIIADLNQSTNPPLPYPISEVNISDWKNTGYRRYLAQQERLAIVHANREAALEMVNGDETTTLPEATLQIIASQYYEFLGDFSPEALKEKLSEDPIKYTRFLNVFSRVAREILNLRKYRDSLAKTAAAELAERDPDRDLADEELRLLVNKMDRTFKVARPNLDAILNGTSDRKRRQASSPSSSASSVSSPANPTSTIEHPGSAQLGDSPESKFKIQNSKIASDCSSRPDEAVFLDPTQHASNGTKPPPINTPVHPRANDAPPPSTVSTVSESAALINTPIDRGANDAPPSPTVSTVSEPAHSQAPPDSTQSKIEIQNSKIPQIPELCPGCQHELPEPTPDGQRPRPECWFCGRRLLPPNTELCPGCRQALPSLALSGERPYENCTLCGFRLSPPGEASIIFTSYSSGPQPAEQ